MEDNDLNKKPEKMNWTKIVLFVSLALNLLVAGFVVGGKFSDGKKEGRNAHHSERLFRGSPYGRALSQEDRREIAREIGQVRRQEFSDSRREMVVLAQSVVAILREDPFDAEKLEGIIEQQIQKGVEIQFSAQKVLIERISQMSDADRQAYADRLEEVIAKGLRKKPSGG